MDVTIRYGDGANDLLLATPGLPVEFDDGAIAWSVDEVQPWAAAWRVPLDLGQAGVRWGFRVTRTHASQLVARQYVFSHVKAIIAAKALFTDPSLRFDHAGSSPGFLRINSAVLSGLTWEPFGVTTYWKYTFAGGEFA